MCPMDDSHTAWSIKGLLQGCPGWGWGTEGRRDNSEARAASKLLYLLLATL